MFFLEDEEAHIEIPPHKDRRVFIECRSRNEQSTFEQVGLALIWANQPLKSVFITFHILRSLIILPWLLVRYGPKSARPFPEWSLKQCMINAVVRQLLVYYTETKSNAMSIVVTEHKKAKERHSLAERTAANLYSSILTSSVWSPNLDEENVVLHFPGGAFVLAFGQEMYGRTVSKAMSQHLMAIDDATRFPAALQDVVTFYSYILSLGVKPHNFIFSGDSAAGNLAVALLRHLETSPSLPLPGGAIVWSPWVYVTPHAGEDYKSSKNAANDCLTAPLLQWGAEAYFPKHELTSEELAYISPLHHSFLTRVPLIIQAGTAEAFFDTIEEFAKQMTDVDGNRVKFRSTDFASHNLILTYDGVGLEHEIEGVLRDASSYFWP
ncbi:Alpha/Beta hydrolase protein [Xylaria digitata]|nr:Alpha/Beta hydrolase protein [Xylaria digitata]